MNKKDLKKNLFDRVKKYNIDENILNRIFRKVYDENLDETIIDKHFNNSVEKYIIGQIRRGETLYINQIINNNKFLKIMLQNDQKHRVDDKFIDKLYEEAIEITIEEYNDKQALNILILKNMKKLSSSYKYISDETSKPVKTVIKKEKEIEKPQQEITKVISKPKIIDNKILSEQIINNKENLINEHNRINASFLKLLILNNIMSKIDLTMQLRTNIDMLNKILSGEHTITEDKLKYLYKKFNATDVYDLKRKIAIKCKYIESDKNVQNSTFNNNKKENKTISKNESNEDKANLNKQNISVENEKNSITHNKKTETNEHKTKITDKKITQLTTNESVKNNVNLNTVSKNELTNDELVSLLIKYKERLNLSEKELSDLLKISQGNINYYMTKKRNISKESIEKILKYFLVTTTKELEEKINSEIEKYNEENISNDELVSLLNKYKERLNLLEKELSDLLKIPQSNMNYYMTKKGNISKVSIEKILKYFSVTTTKELEEKINNEIEKYNEENISNDELVSLLIKYNEGLNLTRKELAIRLDIDYSLFKNNLDKRSKFSKDSIEKILKYFSVTTTKELEEKINSEIEKYNEENISNDELVSLLIKYKERLNLSEKELSDLLKISQGNINYYITKKRNISKESIEKILKYFLVTTTKELEEKINSEIEKYNEENISNDELVSLLIKYKERLNLSEKELSDLLKISQGNMNYYMTKKGNISKASIEKILKYFSVTTTKELEEKINSEIEKYNEENISNDELVSLLNKYKESLYLTLKELTIRLDIDYSLLKKYLNKNIKFSKTSIEKILKYFSVTTTKELEEKINSEIEKNNEENISNDELVSLLIKYNEGLNLTRKELTIRLDIDYSLLKKYLNKNGKFSKTSIEKILKYFSVTTTKELEEKINREIEKYNEENISNDELVSLLIKYKERLNLSEIELSDLLKIPKSNMNYYMTKKGNISKASIEKILKYFSVTTTKELEEKINSEIEKYNEEIRNEIINDKLLLKEETSNAKMSSEEKIEDNELFVDKRINDELPLKQEISNIRPKEKSNVQIIEKNDLLKLVNIDILYSLLDESLKNNTISKEEYIISWFLFGRNEGIFYSKEKISEFLDVDIQYISKTYINCLIIYRNYFDSTLKDISKLKLKNEDK